MAGRAYLDAGGGAPLSPRVREALNAGFAEGWADPSRLAAEPRTARLLLDGAREAIADILNTPTDSIHWSASAHFAFERLCQGLVAARRGRERIVLSAVERDALMSSAEFSTPQGMELLPVDEFGHVDADALARALSVPDVALVALQHANQELGTVQRLDALAALVADAEVPLLVDATSSLGHIDPPAAWDALVAHPADWGGPGGIAVVALKAHTRWLPRWPEHSHQAADAWAPGGVSVPLALASAVALQEREENRAQASERMTRLTEQIRAAANQIDGLVAVGDPVERLPHVVTLSCESADGEALVSQLDREGFAVGSGSACATGTLEPSRVLTAIGRPGLGNIRVALHPGVSDDDVNRFLTALPDVVAAVTLKR